MFLYCCIFHIVLMLLNFNSVSERVYQCMICVCGIKGYLGRLLCLLC